MKTDVVKFESDILLLDKNGDKIDVQVFEPETLELWV